MWREMHRSLYEKSPHYVTAHDCHLTLQLPCNDVKRIPRTYLTWLPSHSMTALQSCDVKCIPHCMKSRLTMSPHMTATSLYNRLVLIMRSALREATSNDCHLTVWQPYSNVMWHAFPHCMKSRLTMSPHTTATSPYNCHLTLQLPCNNVKRIPRTHRTWLTDLPERALDVWLSDGNIL